MIAHLLPLAMAAALVGGLSALERKGALQLMLSRPIVLAPAMGWALGDPHGGLFLGVPLELLFLGGVNLGGSLPDNESLLAAGLTAMVVPAGVVAGSGVDPPLAAMGLAVLFPLALFGRRLERASELRNLQLFAEAQALAEQGDPDPGAIHLRGLWLPFVASAAICALCVFVAPVLGLLRAECGAAMSTALEGAWHAIWAVAAATAIRAVRDPRAPALAAASAAAVVGVTLAARGLL